ncbi:hypothetical protein BKA70DRAFT_1451838 [Coprinopsis sp. MPI-PUGE-AT-0042]|nr:hypothetical protein BKA70DRAFT_1451838 [Coprinopsis sp. MPI-PUGE-AT-0042]
MPEWRELVLGLWGDPSKNETKVRGLDGFVHCFNHTSTFVRGTQGIQTHVVPVATLQGKCMRKKKKKGEEEEEEEEEEEAEEEEGEGEKDGEDEDKRFSTALDLHLELQKVYRNGRALFLDFGHTYLKIWAHLGAFESLNRPDLLSYPTTSAPSYADNVQVAFLTHTSIQCYTKEVWTNSIMAVSVVDRGFKIGLALEFHDFFLSFLTYDLMFQPEWLEVPDPSLIDPRQRLRLGPDIIEDYPGFLKGVADWVKDSRGPSGKNACTGLACNAIRHASLVWVGVGAYTVCEIFFIAGLSPFLLEHEVFDSPSRTARLCEAFWQFAYNARDIFQDYIQRTLLDGIIAPREDHRLCYQDLLYVWAKTSTKVTPCHGQLIANLKNYMTQSREKDLFWYRDKAQLPDAFEPQYMLEALLRKTPTGEKLERRKTISLGPLIFGDTIWKTALKKFGHVMKVKTEDDPLTSMFCETGQLQNARWLTTSLYTDLKDPSEVPHRNWPSPRLYLYATGEERNIWSVLPAFSGRCLAREPEAGCPKMGRHRSPVSEEKRRRKTFKYIVKFTKGVSIGPLEYCGHGVPILMDGYRTSKEYLVAAVRGDPALPPPYREKAILLVVSKQGVRRRVLDKATRSEINKRVMCARATDRLQDLLSQDPPPRHLPPEGDEDTETTDTNERYGKQMMKIQKMMMMMEKMEKFRSWRSKAKRVQNCCHLGVAHHCIVQHLSLHPQHLTSSAPSMRSSSPDHQTLGTPPPTQRRSKIVLSVSPFKTVFKIKNQRRSESEKKDAEDVLLSIPEISTAAGVHLENDEDTLPPETMEGLLDWI